MNDELLRSCKACGKEISRHSPFCRSCGHLQPGALATWIVVGLVLLMLAFCVAFFFMLHLESFLCG